MNKKMNIDDFSGGLWRIKIHLEPYSGDRVEMSVEDIQPFLDASNSNEPLLIRVNRTFIPTYIGGSIPHKYVTIPEDVEDELNIDLPTEKWIHIPKEQGHLKKILLESDEDIL